ncbi:MAG: Methionine--tRNA ligase [Candidatus Omnitrophica bacterium]|nr:Methionine--tRNA ligase [Candidatus Omnitrophota bacterium]
MSEHQRYYLTTPLYYVNSRPHIGHSYTNIACDALARHWRQRLGRDKVFFLTGTDEHGQKIARAAQAAGQEPQAFTDAISGTFRQLWTALNVDYDVFIRTTEERHKQAVRKVWTDLDAKGDIYSSSYQGYYCTPCETFLTEETVRQMTSEGREVTCPDCKRAAERIEETNYFFRMSKYQDWLVRALENGADEQGRPMVVLPETRRNEVLGFLKANKLEDLCVSRPKARLSWGIETPLSSEHVTYVWFDALVNYVSACGYGSDPVALERWWPADVHVIGKDILRHHAIYWTILLKALGLAPPRLIFAHGWWVVGGEKMSKSKGNVVDPVEIAAQYGVDAYRYFLLRETPFGQDGVFSQEALTLRFNTDLANDLGNLLNRSLTMCEKYFGGEVPAFEVSAKAAELKDLVDGLSGRVERAMERLAFHEALQAIWEPIGRANKYIEESAPWTLAKEGRTAELKTVIGALHEVLSATAKMLYPFMPATAEAVASQLGIERLEVVPYPVRWGSFAAGGRRIAKGAPLFPRIEDPDKPKTGDKKKAKSA